MTFLNAVMQLAPTKRTNKEGKRALKAAGFDPDAEVPDRLYAIIQRDFAAMSKAEQRREMEAAFARHIEKN